MVNVLVVDDDEDTRDLIAAILTHAGYTVDTASSGRDALGADPDEATRS